MLLAENLSELSGRNAITNEVLLENFPLVTFNQELISESIYTNRDIILSEAQAEKLQGEIEDWIDEAKQELKYSKAIYKTQAKNKNLVTLICLGVNLTAFVIGLAVGSLPFMLITLTIQMISLVIQLINQASKANLDRGQMSQIKDLKRKVRSMKERSSVKNNTKLKNKLDDLYDELEEFEVEVKNSNGI